MSKILENIKIVKKYIVDRDRSLTFSKYLRIEKMKNLSEECHLMFNKSAFDQTYYINRRHEIEKILKKQKTKIIPEINECDNKQKFRPLILWYLEKLSNNLNNDERENLEKCQKILTK